MNTDFARTLLSAALLTGIAHGGVAQAQVHYNLTNLASLGAPPAPARASTIAAG